ncbi:MAG TPA: DUF5996 family protein [Methyloceanibacter sp.]|jgi:hypothetical protein
MRPANTASDWPQLPYEAWKDSYATLHLWSQIIGKIRMAQTPWLNHSWHVTLYVTVRGLSTSPIPYGTRNFELEFDFVHHVLRVNSDDGAHKEIRLFPRTVADFYADLMRSLSALGLEVRIDDVTNELPEPVNLRTDTLHASYDPDYAHRFWRILVAVERVLYRFRTAFIGKCSPVHFFWGSFDLAVTRFSGRRAPLHPGGVPYLPDDVTQEAYSHEVSSAGFWPGSPGVEYPAFYSYAYPEPPGFSSATIRPPQAFYSDALHEFILPYDVVRTSEDPDGVLMDFLMSTYDAAASLGRWDRSALECDVGVPGISRKVQ